MNCRGWLARDVAAAVDMVDEPNPDVMVFTETHLRDGQEPQVPGYVGHIFSRPESMYHAGGGIAVYVRASLAPRCKVTYVHPDASFATLRFKDVWGAGADMVMIACYISPSSSPRYDGGVWEALEERVESAYGVGEPILVGDFNARTGTAVDYPINELGVREEGEELVRRGCMPTWRPRASSDSDNRINAAGRKLLELCAHTGLRIAKWSGDRRSAG